MQPILRRMIERHGIRPVLDALAETLQTMNRVPYSDEERRPLTEEERQAVLDQLREPILWGRE